MAQVKVQIAISKVAANAGYVGKVVGGWETFQITVKGEPVTKKRLWTMWLDKDYGINKGDVVEFIGELSTKIAPYQAKDGSQANGIEHSLNVTSLTTISKAQLPAVETAPAPSNIPF